MNEKEAQAVLFELYRRFRPKERPKLVRHVYPFIAGFHAAQKRFHADRTKFKAAICSGRAGKSVLAAACLVEACGNIPESNGVYVAPTRGMAKRILWKELKRLNEKWSLGIDFNETDLTATLRNGSQIVLVGANNADQIDKIRGIPIVLAVIDEAGMIGPFLQELIEEVIEPRLMDFDGSILMIGTPTAACAGYFFDVTQEEVEKRTLGWSVHHWTVLDNPYVPRFPTKEVPNAKAWIEARLARRGITWEHPTVQREYLGRWVRSAEHLVFHEFHRKRNLIAEIPTRADYQYGLGVDLGWDDGVGISELAFSMDHTTVYGTRSWRHDKMIVTELARAIQGIEKQRGGLAFVVIDQSGAGKMMAEELRQRWGIACKGAEKAKKPTFLKLLNSDLKLGRLQLVGHETKEGLLAGPNADLLGEIPLLQWDPVHMAKGRYVEDERVPNDVSDGWIYAYRECRHYLYDGEEENEDGIPEQMWPETDSAAALEAKAARHHRQVAESRARKADGDWWDPDAG